jgi:hypothetical protein
MRSNVCHKFVDLKLKGAETQAYLLIFFLSFHLRVKNFVRHFSHFLSSSKGTEFYLFFQNVLHIPSNSNRAIIISLPIGHESSLSIGQKQ